jgi:hypothetical protein
VATDPNLDCALERLETLERQVHQFKRIAFGLSVLIGSLFLMGQERSRDVLESRQLVIRHSNGNVAASLQIEDGQPTLKMYQSDGKIRANLDTSGLILASPGGMQLSMVISRNREGGGISLVKHNNRDMEGEPLFMVLGTKSSSSIHLYGKNKQELVAVENDSVAGPSIAITDAEGYEAVIGRTNLVTTKTGEEHKTSAASLVLFNKERNVVWKAP